MTWRAKDACLRLCVDSSYEAVAAGLARLWGRAPAAETLRQAVLGEGQRLRKQEAERARQVGAGEVREPAASPERLYVALDGGYARGRARRQWYEAKLGAVYPDRRVQVSAHRRQVLGRYNVGTFGSAEQLGELVYAQAFAQGVERARQVVVLGDGASWIKRLQEEQFPGAELRLDAFHVLQALRRALRAAYPEQKSEREEPYREIKAWLWQGQVGRAVARLKRIAQEQPGAGKALGETIEYYRRQARGMPAYGELQARGEMISSALAEETVDRAFNDRFKHRHRHWGREGAEALLGLRLLADRGEWEAYWQPASLAA